MCSSFSVSSVFSSLGVLLISSDPVTPVPPEVVRMSPDLDFFQSLGFSQSWICHQYFLSAILQVAWFILLEIENFKHNYFNV